MWKYTLYCPIVPHFFPGTTCRGFAEDIEDLDERHVWDDARIGNDDPQMRGALAVLLGSIADEALHIRCSNLQYDDKSHVEIQKHISSIILSYAEKYENPYFSVVCTSDTPLADAMAPALKEYVENELYIHAGDLPGLAKTMTDYEDGVLTFTLDVAPYYESTGYLAVDQNTLRFESELEPDNGSQVHGMQENTL